MSKINEIKEQVRVLLSLMRMRNCIIAFFGVLLGASFISFSDILTFNVILAGIAVFLITGAGNTINDYFDYEIDKINKAHRPIPSNRINRSDALMFSVTLFFIGWGLSKYIKDYNDCCLWIAVFNSIVLVLYAKYSKRLHVLSNLSISYLVASIFVFGALANFDAGIIELSKFRLIAVMSACAFLATLSREVIKDIEDMEGDRRAYSVTLPIKIGVKQSKNIALISVLAAILLSIYPFFMNLEFDLVFYGILILIADLTFLISLTTHPALGQRLMIIGMNIALLAFFVGKLRILF
jgi:geranylgeranylglycerol-phosphate geranylgeranyltransferase